MERMIEFTGDKDELQKILNAASPVSTKHHCPAFKKKWINEGQVNVWFKGEDIKVNDLAAAIRTAAGVNVKPASKAKEDKAE